MAENAPKLDLGKRIIGFVLLLVVLVIVLAAIYYITAFVDLFIEYGLVYLTTGVIPKMPPQPNVLTFAILYGLVLLVLMGSIGRSLISKILYKVSLDLEITPSSVAQANTKQVDGRLLLDFHKETNARGIYTMLRKVDLYPGLRDGYGRSVSSQVVAYEDKKMLAEPATYSGKREYAFSFIVPSTEEKADLIKVFFGRMPDSIIALAAILLGFWGLALACVPGAAKIFGITIDPGYNLVVAVFCAIFIGAFAFFLSRGPIGSKWKVCARIDVPLGFDLYDEIDIESPEGTEEGLGV